MRRRAGFTLVEVLVASLLMGMLVTILTMVFNQSSIAWRTGKASAAKMDDMRRYFSQIQRYSDDALPGVLGTTAGRIGGAWRGNGALQRRAVGRWDTSVGINSSSFTPPSSDRASLRCTGRAFTMGKLDTYTVGVWSYGPDGQPNTDDDISTWPVDVR